MEGKKRYIAIILLLLIGLTLFAFAKPVDKKGPKKQGGNGDDTQEVSKDDNSNDGVLETESEKNKQTPVQSQSTQAEDNSYTNALEAVEQAESSFDESDIESAKELIEQITNEEQKQELTERIEILEEALDVMALVEELEEKLEDSKNREDIEDTIDFRDEEEVEDKVESLRNEEVKKALRKKLDKINKVLNDEEAPKYSGVEDGETTNEDVIITIEDETEVEVKVTLDGTEIEYSEDEPFTEEGVYELTITDEAFNEEKITFTIDKTAPSVNTMTYSPNAHTQDDVTITIELSEKIQPIEGWTLSDDETTLTKVFSENAKGKVVITDIAGNEITKEYNVSNIDREAPIVTPSYTEKTIEQYSVETFTDYPTFTVTDNSNDAVSQELISGEVNPSENGQNTLVYRFTDKAGNYTDVEVIVNVTDTTAPLLSGLVDGAYYNTKTTHAIPTATDKNKVTLYIKTTIAGKTLETKWQSGKEIVQVGTYTVYAKDEFGNKSEEITVKIDPYAPKVLVLDRFENVSGAYLPIKPVILEHNLDSIIVKLDGEEIPYEKGQQLTEDGNYEMTVTDKAGNTTTVNFAMDSISPTMLINPLTLGVVDELDLNDVSKIENILTGIYVSEDVEFKLMKATKNISVLDQNIPIYEFIEIPENGIIDEEGQYILIAYDKAYNLTSAKFTVDRTAPVVTGVENDKYYNTDVTINIEEANLNEVPLVGTTLYKNSLPVLDFKNGDTISEDGTYKLIAKDTAGNEADTITFVIDKTAPTIEIPVKEEVLQGTDAVSVVADVTDKNVDNKILTPYVTKIVDGVETDLGLQETIDVTTNGVTYRLFYTVTDKAGNTTETTIETTVVNITYEVRFNSESYEGTYNGTAHSIPEDAKFYMIKDGIESEVTDAVINYTSNAEMINAGEYTITAELNGYSKTAKYIVNKAEITIDFSNLPSKVVLGNTLEELSALINADHYEVTDDIFEYKMYRVGDKLNEILPVETDTVDMVTETTKHWLTGKETTVKRTYTIIVGLKDKYSANYKIKGGVDLSSYGLPLNGTIKTIES